MRGPGPQALPHPACWWWSGGAYWTLPHFSQSGGSCDMWLQCMNVCMIGWMTECRVKWFGVLGLTKELHKFCRFTVDFQYIKLNSCWRIQSCLWKTWTTQLKEIPESIILSVVLFPIYFTRDLLFPPNSLFMLVSVFMPFPSWHLSNVSFRSNPFPLSSFLTPVFFLLFFSLSVLFFFWRRRPKTSQPLWCKLTCEKWLIGGSGTA